MLLKTVLTNRHRKCVFEPHNPFREALVIDFKNGLMLKILRLAYSSGERACLEDVEQPAIDGSHFQPDTS